MVTKKVVNKGNLVWQIGSFKPGVYTSRKEIIYNEQFSDINLREWSYVIPANWDKQKIFNLPRVLTGNLQKYGKGVENLTLSFNLAPGYYDFTLAFLETKIKKIKKGANLRYPLARKGNTYASLNWPGDLKGSFLKKWIKNTEEQIDSANPECNLEFPEVDEYLNQPRSAYCLIFFDKEEIGNFGVTHPRYTVKDNNIFEVREISFPFICWKQGVHSITIVSPDIPNVVNPEGFSARFQSEKFIPVSFRLNQIKEPLSRHSLFEEHPGRVYLDVWGWESPIIYQREKEVGLSYIKNRAINESYKWGANLLEFYLTGAIWKKESTIVSLPMSWDRKDPLKGGDVYKHNKKSIWDDRKLAELTDHVHSKDMLLLWYIHYPYRGEYWNPPRWWIFNLTEKISRDFSNVLKSGWKGSIDGFEQESAGLLTTPCMINQIKRQWLYNPGMFQGETHGLKSDRILPCPTPGTILVTANCCGLGYNGFDDKKPANPFGYASVDGELGKQYGIYQADCRALPTLNKVGGTTQPDWVLKQCNDWFRDRARGDKYSQSGIWWLGEAENICPDWMRRYVYGITQDPIKCAVTSNLASTGRNGIFDSGILTSEPEKKKKQFPIWKRIRYAYPAETSFIQNNYLRAYIFPDKDGGELLYDPEGLAHYDSNSLSLAITKTFVKTIVSKGVIEYDGKYKSFQDYIEPAGYRAILKSKVEFNIPYLKTTIKEDRDFIIDNDTPYLRLKIKRSIEGGKEPIGTVIGCEGYDRLSVDKATYSTFYKFNKAPDIFTLKDSYHLKPDLNILILQKGKIATMEWSPGSSLTFWSNQTKEEIIELALVVPAPLYKKNDLRKLKEMLLNKSFSIRLDESSKTINNTYPIPLVRIVKIVDPDKSPYFVKEKGWWMFRGAQPSLEHPGVDYLKVYLEAKGSATIQRYGFIRDIVKPGWGCQYTLALRNIGKIKGGSRCAVNVLSTTPMLFAPRLHFKKQVRSVRLNGKPWHYFDGDIVFLPNRRGTYHIEVNEGTAETPHIVRTFAVVKGTRWDGKNLTIDTELPDWVKRLPKSLYFTAIVDISGSSIRLGQGYKILRSGSKGTLIQFKAGRIKVVTNR